MSMGITISDIKRALLDGGDVATLTTVWHQALANPPVSGIASLEAPVALPEATALLQCVDSGLEVVLAAWVAAKAYRPLSKGKVDLALVGLAPYGRNISSYLEHIIDEVKPDIILIDTSPVGLNANMLYAFSVPGAVGLPLYGEILTKEGGQLCASETFYPGNMNETAIVKSWLTKTSLLPVGIPKKLRQSELHAQLEYVDGSYIDREMSKSSLLTAYRVLDEELSGVTTLQEGIKITGHICLSLMKTISGKRREVLADEACYIASRIMDVATYASTAGHKARLLAIVDIGHYTDTEYVLGLLEQGITDEVYVSPKGQATGTTMVMSSRNSDELNKQAKEYTPETTLTQKLFQNELDKLVKSKDSEILAESEVDKLLAEIVSRTRSHPDIARGASVRGTIAFKEVLQGLSEMRTGLTRSSITKAALITLPARIVTRQKDGGVTIVNDIAKEVLYDIRFSKPEVEVAPSMVLDWLSPQEIIDSLKNLRTLSQMPDQELTGRRQAIVIAKQDDNQKILKYLESKNILKRGQKNQYTFTRRAFEYMLNELEQKLKAGEITQAEYDREKSRLMAMLEKFSRPQFKMSASELANTIMELMDAQDKQWSRELSFERMHVYYHIKANYKGEELSPQKRDYYGLKVLIDDLEKQGILKAVEESVEFSLTTEALDILLNYLIAKDSAGRGLKGTIDFGKTLVNERRHEIRRYSSGDVFRDISFRHTLKEIAKQKKSLSSIRKSDFRVFMKQHRKLQSDIVLCLDTSGSMGFRQKLMYARLAAAGLAKAAMENGDRVGMVSFDNYGQTTIPLTDKDKDAINNNIVRLRARGNTNIGDGIKCSSQLFSQDHSRNHKHIVLITDGEPTAVSQGAFDQLKSLKEKDLTEESVILEARKASARGIKVSVIHIAGKHEASSEFVKNIARAGKGKIRRMGSPEDLKAVMH